MLILFNDYNKAMKETVEKKKKEKNAENKIENKKNKKQCVRLFVESDQIRLMLI